MYTKMQSYVSGTSSYAKLYQWYSVLLKSACLLVMSNRFSLLHMFLLHACLHCIAKILEGVYQLRN
jgi:hypothetical protein